MEEYFPIVGPAFVESDGKLVEDPSQRLVIHGCVMWRFAHSEARVPHASVLILAVRRGTKNVFIHRRSNKVRVSPNAWDVFGGHVSCDVALLSAPNALAEACMETALREAREEILVTVSNVPYVIERKDLRQIGRLGQFACAEPMNVEYSTAYLLCLPEDAVVRSQSPFEKRDGTIEWLPVVERLWDDVVAEYRQQPNSFADGISRLLRATLACDDITKAIELCGPNAGDMNGTAGV